MCLYNHKSATLMTISFSLGTALEASPSLNDKSVVALIKMPTSLSSQKLRFYLLLLNSFKGLVIEIFHQRRSFSSFR